MVAPETRNLKKDSRGKRPQTDSEQPAGNSIKEYFKGIRGFKLLTAVEEKKLSRRVAKGDRDARRQMIEANLRLVVNIAKRYITRGLPLQDLIEEGNLGLIRAVERFKASKGCRFSTYATYWIRQSVERAIINQSMAVRLPIHVNHDLYKMHRCTVEFEKLYKKKPSATELAERMGVTGRYLKKLTTINGKCVSFDAVLGTETTETLLDRIEDDKVQTPFEVVGDCDRSKHLRRFVALLDDIEKTVINLRFGLDGERETLERVGKRFGVTRERVRQIEAKALLRLKAFMAEEELDSPDAV
jgi:RNA polymerase primary sigma factor